VGQKWQCEIISKVAKVGKII